MTGPAEGREAVGEEEGVGGGRSVQLRGRERMGAGAGGTAVEGCSPATGKRCGGRRMLGWKVVLESLGLEHSIGRLSKGDS